MNTNTAFLTTDEVAREKNVNRETVLRAIRRGDLPATSFGQGKRKTWLIPRAVAERWQPNKPGRPPKK